MIRVTRDQDELGDVPFTGFYVWTHRPNKDETIVCGYQVSHEREAGIECFSPLTPIWIPVAQAFENACHDAKTKGVSAIWINDPRRLFDVEPWVRQGLTTNFDDHS
jgi:hypothetical protein